MSVENLGNVPAVLDLLWVRLVHPYPIIPREGEYRYSFSLRLNLRYFWQEQCRNNGILSHISQMAAIRHIYNTPSYSSFWVYLCGLPVSLFPLGQTRSLSSSVRTNYQSYYIHHDLRRRKPRCRPRQEPRHGRPRYLSSSARATSCADSSRIATRTHSAREKYLDVHTFAPFGAGVFLASDVPCARIAPADVLAILPPRSPCELAEGLLELPQQEYSQYIAHSSRHQKRHESMWNAWLGRN